MTVQELIELLQEMDPYLEVMVYDYNRGRDRIGRLEVEDDELVIYP